MNGATPHDVMGWAKRAMSAPGPIARDDVPQLLPSPAAPTPERAWSPPPLPTATSGYAADPPRTGYVRIPFMAKAADAMPLQRTIAYAADRTGLSPFEVAMVVTYLFEGIATEVGIGRVVRIPGFGVFGPWAYESKKDGSTAVQPRFYAARPFKLEVRAMCDPADAKNDALMAYLRSHHPSSKPGKATARTSTAMEAFRVSLLADPAYVGRR
jgi:hypothetical protein